MNRLNRKIVSQDPPVPVDVDGDLLAKNLRTARRGVPQQSIAFVGESGVHGIVRCDQVGERKALEIVPAIRLGRTALQKPDGGIRGTVVGDVFRRLVARTLAQQFGPQVECATHPFQDAPSTRARTECVIHVVQALTGMD